MTELYEKEAKADDIMDTMLAEAKQAAASQQDAAIMAEMKKKQDEQMQRMGFVTSSDFDTKFEELKAKSEESIDRKMTELKSLIYVVKSEQDKLKELITRARAQGKALIPPQDAVPKTEKQLNTEIYGDIEGL